MELKYKVENGTNQVKYKYYVPVLYLQAIYYMYFCLDSIFSTENHQNSANWELIGKSLVKRTDSDNKPCVCPLHRHTAQFVLELRAHCGASSGCSSLLWFVGSLLCRLLFAVFNDLIWLRRESCVFASMCAFACLLTPLTCTSFPPVAEQRRREASTENTSSKVTSRFSSPLLCPWCHPITRNPAVLL